MNYIQVCEDRLLEHLTARQQTSLKISGIPQVVIDGVRAVYSNDRKALDEFGERVLLGSGAKVFIEGPYNNDALIKARAVVLEGRPSLNETPELSEQRLDEATVVFRRALRTALGPYVDLYRYKTQLDDQIAAEEAALEFALAALTSRSIRRGEPITRKDLGTAYGPSTFLITLAAECAWVKEEEVRQNLSVQLSSLAADVPEDPEQFKKDTGFSWRDWVYQSFEEAATRRAPWAARYARRLRTELTELT